MLTIELRSIGDIRPYPNNPRNNDKAVDAVAASIGIRLETTDRCRQRQRHHRRPYAFEGRAEARHWIGYQCGCFATVYAEQVRAYRIADNKTAEIADWNYDLLPIELSALQEADYDLGLLGFDADELAKLIDTGVNEGLTDPDDVPLPPDEAITQPGDLWILGNHRLLCGDSANRRTSRSTVGRRTDPSCQYGPAVQRQGGAATQERDRSRFEFVHQRCGIGRAEERQGKAASFAVDHETSKPTHAATHKRFAPRIVRLRMTSSPMMSSIDCSTHGSETLHACWSLAAASTSGVATPTAATIHRS